MQTYFRKFSLNVNCAINNFQVLKIIKVNGWKIKVKNNQSKNEKSTQNRNFQIILTITIRKKSWILQLSMILKYNTKKERKKLFLTCFKTFN